MTTALINQLKPFEIFVERLESFVNKVKTDEILKKAGFKICDMDLRTKDGDIFSIPEKLEDYFDIWACVKQYADDYFSEPDLQKREIWGMNEFFFDLYWNDIEGKSAYYQDMVFWVFFDDKEGICYEEKN
jgi:hypothetical protein